MYESPIEKVVKDISNQRIKEEENCLLVSVEQAIGFRVDKNELLKALQYDRGQYEKGFADGESLVPKWIPCSERLPESNTAVNITYVNREPESYYSHIKGKPFVATGVYCKGQWYWWNDVIEDLLDEYGSWNQYVIDDGIEVLAWMPLPEPYKAESEYSGYVGLTESEGGD